MKSESVVIANQQVAVNTFSLLVQIKYAPSAHTIQLVKIQRAESKSAEAKLQSLLGNKRDEGQK
jgi:hypothetical protein